MGSEEEKKKKKNREKMHEKKKLLQDKVVDCVLKCTKGRCKEKKRCTSVRFTDSGYSVHT